jgi:hypothetical protein
LKGAGSFDFEGFFEESWVLRAEKGSETIGDY